MSTFSVRPSVAIFGPVVKEYDGIRPLKFVLVNYFGSNNSEEYFCTSIDKQIQTGTNRITITYSIVDRNKWLDTKYIKNVYLSGELLKESSTANITMVQANSVKNVFDWMNRVDFEGVFLELTLDDIIRNIVDGHWEEEYARIDNGLLRDILAKTSARFGVENGIMKIVHALLESIKNAPIRFRNTKNITMINEISENGGKIPVDVFGEWKERFAKACTESMMRDANIDAVIQTLTDVLNDPRNKKEYMYEFIQQAWYGGKKKDGKGDLWFLKKILLAIKDKYGADALKTAASDAWDGFSDTYLKSGDGPLYERTVADMVRDAAGKPWLPKQ